MGDEERRERQGWIGKDGKGGEDGRWRERSQGQTEGSGRGGKRNGQLDYSSRHLFGKEVCQTLREALFVEGEVQGFECRQRRLREDEQELSVWAKEVFASIERDEFRKLA